MQPKMNHLLFPLLSLLTTLHALTITYPTAGSNVDPSQPITIRWTTSPSDPSTFNLFLTSPSGSAYTNSNSGVGQLASNVPTSSGTYTIPANKISAYGPGFMITVNTSAGDKLATTGSFTLAEGTSSGGATVVDLGNGQYSLVPAHSGAQPAAAQTQTQTPVSSLVFQTPAPNASVTATYLQGVSTGVTLTTASVSGTSTSTSSSSSVSASASATKNAQPKIDVGREVMGAVGLVAGVFAFMV